MPCYSPIGCYAKPGGGIAFTPAAGYFDRHKSIPCGQCIGCRLEKSRQWAVRMLHESQMHSENCFLTLTYDQEHYPEDCSLNVKHWQAFAKKLRKSYGPFRFYHCGEYGDKTFRAHYHAAIFGLDFHQDRKKHKDHTSASGLTNTLYTSETLQEIWGKGHVLIGDLTFESASYIAQYVTKKLNNSNKLSLIGLQKEPYATMSRRPGIGASWYSKYKTDVYPRDEVIMRGKQMQPPIYYDTLFELEHPEEMAQIKQKRRIRSKSNPQEQTPERRKVKEKCKTMYGQHFARDLFT